MRFDPKRHHHRSTRLKGYDYSQLGAYFVTICVQDRECLFGEVVEGEMRLNEAGRMVQDVWNDLPRYYPDVALDAFVVMPNHIHGIIILVGAGPCACPDTGQPPVGAGPRACPDAGQPQGVAPTLGLPDVGHLVGAGPCACPDPGQPQRVAPTLGLPDVGHLVGAGPCACPDAGQPHGVARTLGLPDVVHRFKTMTTKRYADGVKRFGWLPFRGRLWQRNYYEHIIRNEESLNRIREYILTNPMRWVMDCENPHRQDVDPLDEWANSFRWREDTDAR